MAFLKKFAGTALVLVLVFASAVLLSACGKEPASDDIDVTDETDSTDTSEEDDADTTDTTDTDVEEDTTEDTTEDDTTVDEDTEDETPTGDFTSFSANTQTVGSSADKATASYTLASITDSQQTGFHRFVFDLESSQTSFANVEARLVSAGGYIRILLDRVTTDNSGIIYQGTREINKEGVLKLYHAVTPNESEEVYQIGISRDTTYYLHTEDGLKVILDVKYPGAVENTGGATDSMEFTTSATTLSGTNTAGDVRFGSYSWSTESTLLKFIWNTASASGNTTPQTVATYYPSSKNITVTFTGVQTDTVIGPDNTFSSPLANVVTEVTGSRSGTTSTYVFQLTKETTYRIYRSSSPNQVILDIKR